MTRELNSTRPDVDGAPTRVAIGIYLIELQERLHSTGGGLVINSRPTAGTRNTARAPLTAASVQTEALQV